MALRFDLDKMRPWEWANWEADEADLMTTLTYEFRHTIQSERDVARKDAERMAAMTPKGGKHGA